MRDTLDINAGKNRIWTVLFFTAGTLIFIALLVFLIMRKNDIRSEELTANQSSEPINRIDGEEVFPELFGSEETTEGDSVMQEAELPLNTYALPEKETVTFTFAGDVLLDDGYAIMSTYRANDSVLENCIDPKLLEIMRGSDVFMVNNEFTYTDRGTPLANKAFTFRANPENVSIMQDMGVDIVSLANNHAFDYGEVSLLDTLDTLEGADIPYVGAGRNLEEASKVVYYQNGNIKIGIVAATEVERMEPPNTRGATETTPGTFRCFKNDDLEAVIKEAKQNCDFLIVYVHWGTESTDQLDWSQPGQAEDFVTAGADVIIGAHPHVLQEIAYVNGVPVFYSLGNYWFNSKTSESCLVTLEIGEDGLVSARFIPCITSGSKTQMATGEDAKRIIQYMQELSETVNIDEEGYVTIQ